MIEKIKLINFRKHAKKIISFGPGVTTIQGSSFSGKSTIVRALRWVMKNQPAGDDMINWDADNVLVRLDIDDQKIIRKRDKSKNLYKLDKKKFVSFKNNVPSEIEKILNVSDINFQGQFDTHFWFSLTAGEVSRRLNSIVNLEIIDKTLSEIASQQRKTTTVIEVAKERLEDLSDQKAKLKYIRQLNIDLKGVEKLRDRQKEIAGGCVLLADLLNMAVKYRTTVKNAVNQVSDAKSALSTGELYRETASKLENLSELLKTAEDLQAEVDRRPPSLESVEIAKAEYEKYQKDLCELELRIESVVDKEKRLCQRQEKLKEAKKQFKQVAGNKCPLCGGKLLLKK